MIYDFIIVGGGVSGLLCFHKLREKGFQRVLIIESNLRLGGRIDTEWTAPPTRTWLDKGAARFNSSQKRMMDLLKKLKLNDKIRSLKTTPVGLLTVQRWNEINKLLKKNPMKTPEEIIQDKDWIQTTGYIEDFSLASASAFLTEWSYYHPDALDDWYELSGGLSQVIDALRKDIPEKNIILGELVKNVDFQGDVWNLRGDNGSYQASKVVFTLQPSKVKKLVPKWSFPYKAESLIRIFVQATGNLEWLKQNPIYYRKNGGQILSLLERTDETGWFELNYNSGLQANKLLRNYLEDEEKAVKDYEKDWKKLTGETIKVNHVSVGYWRNGVEWYLPNNQSFELYLKELRENGEKQGLYFIGDSFSNFTGWIEGCLESIEKQNFPSKGGKRNFYNLTEVAKHNKINDAWIVIRGKVYDITNWIPKHPGGMVIMKGVGKDATELFERAHPNLTLPRKILKKYLIGKLDK